MQEIELQFRISCPACSTHNFIDVAHVRTGRILCSVCQTRSDLPIERLRDCVADLIALVARSGEGGRHRPSAPPSRAPDIVAW